MSLTTKLMLIIASLLVVIGIIVFCSVMTKLGWDFKKLSTVKYETNVYEFTDEFKSINIKSDTGGIVFSPSEDGKCKVECYEEENARHSVSIIGGVLTLKQIKTGSVLDYVGINFDCPKIKIYLPKADYDSLGVDTSTGDIEIPKDFEFMSVDISLSTGDVSLKANIQDSVKIKSNSGDISVENINAGSVDLSVNTGRVKVSGVICGGDFSVKVSTGKSYLYNIKCKNFLSEGSTGDVALEGVIAQERLSINRSTGDVGLTACDGGEIYIETGTGSVKGSVLSDKTFYASSISGSVDVPKTSGTICEIKTNTGSIKITVEKP